MPLTSSTAAIVHGADQPGVDVQILTTDAYASVNAKAQDLDAFYDDSDEKDSKSDSIETGVLEKSVNEEGDILAAKGKLR